MAGGGDLGGAEGVVGGGAGAPVALDHLDDRRFRALVEHGADAIAVVDAAGTFRYVSPPVGRLLGWTPEELVGRNAFELVPPEDVAWTGARFVGLLERPGETVTLEHPFLRRDGSVAWLESTITNLLAEPDVGAIVSNFRDASARRRLEAERERLLAEARAARARAEAAAREQGEALALLDTLLTAAPNGFALFDRNLRFVRVNAAMAAINGLPPEAHLGRTVGEVAPAVAPLLEPLMARVLETGEAVADLEVSGETGREPGVERSWLVSSYPVRSAEGPIIGVGGSVVDITERTRAEAELRRAEQRYAAFVAQSSEGIWRFETGGPIPTDLPEDRQLELMWANSYLGECNDAMARMYGLGSAAELVGARLGDLLVREDPANEAYLRAFIGAGYRLTGVESVERDAEGNERYFRNSLVGVVEDGCLTRAWGTQSDVTARRVAEWEVAEAAGRERAARALAEEAVRQRDEFLATASHDLKSPLTMIRGRAQLLRRRAARTGGGVARLAEDAATIEDAAIRMGELIDELLDVSFLRVGQALALDLSPTDLVALAREEIGRHERAAGRHDLRVETDLSDLIVTADAPRLRRVLGNLLENAVKYSPDGGEVTVSVRRETDDAGVGWAVLAVSDRGIGIPAADLPRVFERFHRASNAVGRARGTGLGLAGARQVVEQHGGTLGVESVEGEGSTFAVRLPSQSGRAMDSREMPG